jgi:transcriptional regulator with XRE-family HTH domain
VFANLGKTLSLLRDLRGLSQATLARKARIGKSQLSKYESGKDLPRLDSLQRVLGGLEVGYFELFYTLQLVDRRSESLGRDMTALDEVSAPPLGRLYSKETEMAFDLVFALLARLQRRVWEDALARGTGRPELSQEGEIKRGKA